MRSPRNPEHASGGARPEPRRDRQLEWLLLLAGVAGLIAGVSFILEGSRVESLIWLLLGVSFVAQFCGQYRRPALFRAFARVALVLAVIALMASFL